MQSWASPARRRRSCARRGDEFRAQPQYEEVVRSTDDFDAGKHSRLCQDLLSSVSERGQLDAIVMRVTRPALQDFRLVRNGRDEIKFIVGDYPEDVRQLISEGNLRHGRSGPPYPQAYSAMKMAQLHFNGKGLRYPPVVLSAPAAYHSARTPRNACGLGLPGTSGFLRVREYRPCGRVQKVPR